MTLYRSTMLVPNGLVWLLVFVSVSAVDWDVTTPLDEYVQSNDGYFQWTELTSYSYDDVTLYILNMTSQRYMTDAFVTRSVWWHLMGIAIPNIILYPDFGVLWIGGQDNVEDGTLPPEDYIFNMGIVKFANETGYPVGYILNVPNQPVIFANDPEQRSRSEDNIIAWTWRTYLDDPNDPSDQKVILRMPMTLAAKRGLDTLNQFVAIKAPGTDLQRFGIAGASKRGWTTWSLAATDRRVVIAVPLVFSLIKLSDTVMHHYQVLDGHYSFALEPYWACNLTQEQFNPKTAGIFEIEDMWEYRERFTIPLLAVSASGDEFFVLDENRFWWNGIPSQHKYLQMIPNAEHTMFPHWVQIYETVISFFHIYLNNLAWPTVTWGFPSNPDGSGSIQFTTNPQPVNITAFSASTLENDTRRDFRLVAGPPGDTNPHPVAWNEDLEVVYEGANTYRVDADQVPGEWRGFFVEGTWLGPTGRRMIFTSQVNVIPQTYPHGPCYDEVSCWGTLI